MSTGDGGNQKCFIRKLLLLQTTNKEDAIFEAKIVQIIPHRFADRQLSQQFFLFVNIYFNVCNIYF